MSCTQSPAVKIQRLNTVPRATKVMYNIYNFVLSHKHTSLVLMHTHMHNTHAGYPDHTKHMKGAMKYNEPVEGIFNKHTRETNQ